MTIQRIDRLEAIAYWANQGLVRRQMYEALSRGPDETHTDYQERRQGLWAEVESADAMTRAEIRCLEQEHGGIHRYGNIVTKDGAQAGEKKQ